MSFDPAYMTKRFLGEIRTTGLGVAWWRVFSTGRQGWVLLDRITAPGGVSTGFQVAYPRRRFKRGVLPPEK